MKNWKKRVKSLKKTIKKMKKPQIRKISFAVYCAFVFMANVGAIPVLATNDPLAVVNNLSDFIFNMIRAIGMILTGLGVVQIGLSMKSHDPSQRANGFMTIAGGIIIMFAKEILNIIVG